MELPSKLPPDVIVALLLLSSLVGGRKSPYNGGGEDGIPMLLLRFILCVLLLSVPLVFVVAVVEKLDAAENGRILWAEPTGSVPLFGVLFESEKMNDFGVV